MGRHSDEAAEAAAPGRSGLTVVSIIAILAVLLIGFALRDSLAAKSDDAGSGAAGQSAPTSNDDVDATATSDAPYMGEDAAAETSVAIQDATLTGSAAEPTDVEEPVTLQRCREEVAAGDEWATATADSAAHWKQHYMASVQYNAGDITLHEAEAAFAASKVKGATDMKAVSSSKGSYSESQGACASMSADEVPQRFGEAAQACQARAAVIGDVVPVGTEVNNDWGAHLAMMKSKDTTDPQTYYKRWRDMVSMAPSDMTPYEEAADDLVEAPSCPSA